jgi:tetratricopeptide (TPR) repeat protein
LFFGAIFFARKDFLFAYDYDQMKQTIKEYEQKYAYDPYNDNIKKQLGILYHNYAMALAEEGIWTDAIDNAKRAYDVDPDEIHIQRALAYLYNCRGLELKDEGRFKEAVDDLKTAIDFSPEEPVLKQNLAGIYLVWANNFYEKNEYSNAERMLVHVERYDDKNPYLYVMRGDIAYLRDNYYTTHDNWKKALTLNPGLIQLRIKLEKLEKEREVERNFNVREIENFKLKFEGVETEGLADKAAEILRQAYKKVGKDFDLYPRATVPVIIYPAVKLKKLDYFPDWAAGSYDGKIRFGEDLGQDSAHMKATLFHEYTHVVVRMLGGDNVPLWLNEGLAEYQAQPFLPIQVKKARKEMIQRAMDKKSIFSLDKMGSMDLNRLSYLSPHRITLVYAQSEDFVSYLIDRSSLYDIKRLLQELKKGVNIYKAVKDVLYVDLDVLERDWANQYEN